MSQGQLLSNRCGKQRLSFLLLLGFCFLAVVGAAQEAQQTVFWYRSPVSMGSEGFKQSSTKRLFYLLASAENVEFQGLKVTRKSVGGTVLTPQGSQLAVYPSTLNFRVTASTIDAQMFAGSSPIQVSDDTDLNALLLSLHYRLKVYRGLKMTVLQPSSVKLIGIPADTPANERIYRISFNTDSIPVDARLCLEIFSPKGEKLTRMHLELL